MAELLLVNPRKRGRRKKTRGRKRRRNPVATLAANPRRRRTYRKRRRNPLALSTNPRRRSYRKRRRNPLGKMKLGNILQDAVLPAATAAGGALALDIILGLLPIPETMKSGPMRHLVKGAGAIGMGMIAGMVVDSKTAKLFTTGALTVAMHDAGKELVGRFMPTLALGAYEIDDELDMLGYAGPGFDPGDTEGMSAYEVGDDDEMGALSLEDDDLDLDL